MRSPIKALDVWWEKTSPKRRLDHHPLYVCVLVGLLGPALSIVMFGPLPASALAGMSDTLQVMLCTLLVMHSVIGLHAVFLGTRFYLKGPLKRAYRLGYSAAPAGVASLFVYGVVVLANAFQSVSAKIMVMSALSGILTPLLGLGVALQALLFWLESRRIERNEKHIIAGMRQ